MDLLDGSPLFQSHYALPVKGRSLCGAPRSFKQGTSCTRHRRAVLGSLALRGQPESGCLSSCGSSRSSDPCIGFEIETESARDVKSVMKYPSDVAKGTFRPRLCFKFGPPISCLLRDRDQTGRVSVPASREARTRRTSSCGMVRVERTLENPFWGFSTLLGWLNRYSPWFRKLGEIRVSARLPRTLPSRRRSDR